ncbi:MAG: SMP-30/gluconolactonase/LRE family protein [Panacagrimonas sp.]
MRITLLIITLLLGYLLVWPVPIQPIAWTPPPAPSLKEGLFAANDKLRGVQRLADGVGQGPEAIAFDSTGRVYSGLHDGRVFSMAADGSDCRVLANTGGRPLGLSVAADGTVFVADAIKGLLSLAPSGEIKLLANMAEGFRLGFADDLDVDAAGRIYFSDASWKFGYGQHLLDALEHGARGRLLRYEPDRGEAVTLLVNRQFANGVALGPDDAYVLLNETTEYKITRMWLLGEKAGEIETFAENLPGFPDNLTFNGRDRFWVALYAPRDAMLDSILPNPFLRQIAARLPAFLQPAPERQAFIVGLDLDGRVAEQYQFSGKGAFAPVTSVREHEGWLYVGSLSDTAIGRIRLDDLRRSRPGSLPPDPVAHTCGEVSPRGQSAG